MIPELILSPLDPGCPEIKVAFWEDKLYFGTKIARSEFEAETKELLSVYGQPECEIPRFLVLRRGDAEKLKSFLEEVLIK